MNILKKIVKNSYVRTFCIVMFLLLDGMIIGKQAFGSWTLLIGILAGLPGLVFLGIESAEAEMYRKEHKDEQITGPDE